jgi:hypothetical protein
MLFFTILKRLQLDWYFCNVILLQVLLIYIIINYFYNKNYDYNTHVLINNESIIKYLSN